MMAGQQVILLPGLLVFPTYFSGASAIIAIAPHAVYFQYFPQPYSFHDLNVIS